MSDDKVTQNHWGSGHNINAETVTIGRQEFVLTQEILDQLADHFSGTPAVGISWVGSQKSRVLSEQIAEFLEGRGIRVGRRGGMMFWGYPDATNINVDGNHIIVDASK